MFREKRKAFTLVELLVVIGIIAVLISILLPVIGRARQQAQRTLCSSNLRQIGTYWHMYALDYKGYFPSTPIDFGNWNLITTYQRTVFIEKYKLKNGAIMYCPEYKSFLTNTNGGSEWERDWNKPNTVTIPLTYFIGYQIFAGQIKAKEWSDQQQNNFPPPFKNNEKRLAERPLAFDQVTSVGGAPGSANLNFSSTMHLDPKTQKPAGSNALYGDGHADWRPWKIMIPVFYDTGYGGGFTRYY